MIIDPTGSFSSTDPRSDVWSYLPIPTSEPPCWRRERTGMGPCCSRLAGG
jgi:hypothetical protein